jgi:uncharacterized membrane protein (UPF0127 family)
METSRFCVYNQTSECFLSLGVTAAETMKSQSKSPRGKHTQGKDEGLWVVLSSGFHLSNLGVPVPLDLVYLDPSYRVVHVVESFHKFLMAPPRIDAASVLALPAHTIYSSQTQPGDQLAICVAEDMEFQFGGAPSLGPGTEMSVFEAAIPPRISLTNWFTRGLSRNRRKCTRQKWPRLVAHDWDGAELVVHGIRDASPNGLYLLTEKRWPLSALVWMTLQRTDNSDDSSESSITVQMKVTRWGTDGVGLEFVQPETLEPGDWIEREQMNDEPEEISMQDKGTRFIN